MRKRKKRKTMTVTWKRSEREVCVLCCVVLPQAAQLREDRGRGWRGLREAKNRIIYRKI